MPVVNCLQDKRSLRRHEPQLKSLNLKHKLQITFTYVKTVFQIQMTDFYPFTHWFLHSRMNISSVSLGLYYTNLWDTCQHLLGSYLWVCAKAALCECWWGESSVRPWGLQCLCRGCPSNNWTERARRCLIIPEHFPSYASSNLQPRRRKWGLCESRAALIFMYTFFFFLLLSAHNDPRLRDDRLCIWLQRTRRN